jgi:uncharacterized protein (DUF2141 family)
MSLRLLLAIVAMFIALSRCATIKQPTGGPKDTIPPILVRSIPENNQKNFKGKALTLTFNEFIKLKDSKEIIITPSPGKAVNISAKQKTLTIEPKEKWHDSTTYSIAFRESVQDITESNPVENLHLAFSTGPVIDSLSISGSIRYALKETIPEKIIVAVYQADTFNIAKHKASYFTKTDKKGHFLIQNLKPGLYHIYAFDDKNKNIKVETQSEMFGFISKPIDLRKNIDTIQIGILNIDSRALKLKSVRHNEKFTKLRFNKYLTSYKIKFPHSQSLLNTFGDDQTEINIYHSIEINDSIPITVHVQDSINQAIDTTVYVKSSPNKIPKEKFKFAITSTAIDVETGKVTAVAKFNIPLKTIQMDTIRIKIDSASSIAVAPQNVTIDTAINQASFQCSIDKTLLVSLEEPPQLYISKGVFISIENDSSKIIKVPIPFLKPDETGTLSVDVKTKETNFEVQLVTKDYKILQRFRNSKKIIFKNIPPAEYKLRALIDTNKNTKWDVGNVNKQEEPEKIIYYKSESKYEFSIRANWEVGPLLFRF